MAKAALRRSSRRPGWLRTGVWGAWRQACDPTQELRECGLKVWYDEFELRIGDSLRRKIDQGIANSRFGIVVLSPSFIAKGWPAYELDGLVTRSIDGSQVLLPLWHKLTKAEVIAFSPSLADKLARTTADNTLAEIAAEIADVVLRQPRTD